MTVDFPQFDQNFLQSVLQFVHRFRPPSPYIFNLYICMFALSMREILGGLMCPWAWYQELSLI